MQSFEFDLRFVFTFDDCSSALFSSTPLLQAQLVDLRSELTEVKSERAVLEREVHDQLLQLHALQLQLHAKQCQADDSGTIKDRLVCNERKIFPQPSWNGMQCITECAYSYSHIFN